MIMRMVKSIVMGNNMVKENFLKMMQTVDAFFPIGAFTLSNGLEDFVIRDVLCNSRDLEEYLEGFLTTLPYQDLGLISLAFDNASCLEKIKELDAVAGAIKPAKEVRLGSIKMATRFHKARLSMNDCDEFLQGYIGMIEKKECKGYHPIALGIYGKSLDMDKNQLLLMYGYSLISAIVNNAVKLVPLSQLDGQRVLFNKLSKLEEIVDKAMKVDEKMLGITGASYDLHCMLHEKLYSRQYMS